MRIRCECGRDFVTPDHEETVAFTSRAVVGPLGPDHVRDEVVLSRAHTCPHCEKGLYSVIALELTHLSDEDKAEFERFMLRFYRRGGAQPTHGG
jgi:hypothetical protein